VAIATKHTTRDEDTTLEAVDWPYLDALAPTPPREDALEDASRDGRRESRRNGARQANATVIEPGQREPTRPASFAAMLDLWVASWETELAALASATQTGTLSTAEAAIHRTVIAAERGSVTKQLRLLVSQSRFARPG
jgi:hypothetical protein